MATYLTVTLDTYWLAGAGIFNNTQISRPLNKLALGYPSPKTLGFQRPALAAGFFPLNEGSGTTISGTVDDPDSELDLTTTATVRGGTWNTAGGINYITNPNIYFLHYETEVEDDVWESPWVSGDDFNKSCFIAINCRNLDTGLLWHKGYFGSLELLGDGEIRFTRKLSYWGSHTIETVSSGGTPRQSHFQGYATYDETFTVNLGGIINSQNQWFTLGTHIDGLFITFYINGFPVYRHKTPDTFRGTWKNSVLGAISSTQITSNPINNFNYIYVTNGFFWDTSYPGGYIPETSLQNWEDFYGSGIVKSYPWRSDVVIGNNYTNTNQLSGDVRWVAFHPTPTSTSGEDTGGEWISDIIDLGDTYAFERATHDGFLNNDHSATVAVRLSETSNLRDPHITTADLANEHIYYPDTQRAYPKQYAEGRYLQAVVSISKDELAQVNPYIENLQLRFRRL